MSLLESSILRKTLWILLLGITIAIFHYPFSITPTLPLPVQTIYMFPNLPLFGTLFYLWMLLLLLLLFSGHANMLEKLGLCFIFVLVFNIFWIINSPWGGSYDTLRHLGELQYIQEVGKITPQAIEIFVPLYFPGFQLTVVPLAEISGLNNFQVQVVFLTALNLMLALMLFTVFLKFLKNSFYASLAAVLSLASSVLLVTNMTHFHPISLATFLIAFFVLLAFRGGQGKPLLLLVASAATIGYPFTPFLFSFILFSIYAIHRVFKQRTSVTLVTAIIPAVFIASWELYQAPWHFESIVSVWPKIWADLRAGEFFWATKQTVEANIGPAYPWWGNVTRLFWWLFVFGFGTLLMLWKLPYFKRHGYLERIQISALVGVLITILVGTLGTYGAVHGGISRYIWIAPFFVVPSLVKFPFTSGLRRFGIAFLFIALLIFSFPTFLTNQDTFAYKRIYLSEHCAVEFIKATSEVQQLHLYNYGYSLYLYHIPKAVKKLADPGEPYNRTEEEVWKTFNNIIRSFISASQGINLFVHTEKFKLLYQEYLNIPPEHANWGKLESELLRTNRIYFNNLMEIYTN